MKNINFQDKFSSLVSLTYTKGSCYHFLYYYYSKKTTDHDKEGLTFLEINMFIVVIHFWIIFGLFKIYQISILILIIC